MRLFRIWASTTAGRRNSHQRHESGSVPCSRYRLGPKAPPSLDEQAKVAVQGPYRWSPSESLEETRSKQSFRCSLKTRYGFPTRELYISAVLEHPALCKTSSTGACQPASRGLRHGHPTRRRNGRPIPHLNRTRHTDCLTSGPVPAERYLRADIEKPRTGQ